MKASTLVFGCIFASSCLAQTSTLQISTPAVAHKLRVYVIAMETRDTLFHGRESLTGDQTTQTTEAQKLFVKECPDVVVTTKADKADYTFSLARQSRSSRGAFGRRDKWTLANKDGDLIGGNAVHEIGNAVKDACALIKKDAPEVKK